MSVSPTTETPPVVVDETSLPIPALIRRNTWLLTIAEMFTGTAQQMVPTLSSIIIAALLGSDTFAGVGSSLLGLTRTVVSYPSGELADRFGRKPVLLLGLAISLVGAVALGLVIPLGSAPLFFGAMLVFALGAAASQQQRRLSASDFFPPSRRAQGLGYVLTGSLAGAFGGPVLIGVADRIANQGGWSPLAVPWLLIPIFIVPSFVLIALIRPDPREIALHLERYYPGYQPPTHTGTAGPAYTPVRALLSSYPQVVALVSMLVLFGNMSMMMAMTPLAMAHEGMSLEQISITVALHVAGMYGPSAPMGRLADAYGRRAVLLLGLLLSTVGTVLAALSTDYPVVVLGLFLIGVGWCGGNVATPAIIADTAAPSVRGRAMGMNSTLSALASVVAPLLGGILMEGFGPVSLVVISFLVLAPCLVIVLRLREIRPGHYAHAASY